MESKILSDVRTNKQAIDWVNMEFGNIQAVYNNKAKTFQWMHVN